MKNSKIQYRELSLPESTVFDQYKINSADNALGPLSLINLFIGSNNSGKSRFLRYLFNRDDYAYTTNKTDANKYYKFLEERSNDFSKLFTSGVVSIGGIGKQDFQELLRTGKTSRFFLAKSSIYGGISSLIDKMCTVKERKGHLHFHGSSVVYHINEDSFYHNMEVFGNKLRDEFEDIKFDIRVSKRFYVPIIRGMRPLREDHANIYEQRTIKDYFTDGGKGNLLPSCVIFTGLELYKSLKEKLLGEPEDRESVREFQGFLSKNFFDNKSLTLTPREGEDTVHVKIGKEKQLPIYNLGDGLQNLIILTFNMFMEQRRCLFFIEEPDLCMHPGLQRAFLQVLSEHDRHQYFITTHSNHLLDMTLDFSDISVFLFKKSITEEKTEFSIQPVSSNDKNALIELGVLNSSVFLTNATVWVEGITDRLYLKTYMKKYIDKNSKYGNLREDVHYSFVEYQGSNLVHWDFSSANVDTERIKACFLCGSPFLLSDGDIINKGNRKEVFEKMLGKERFEVLECKEIENLIPEEVVKELIKKEFTNHNKDASSINYKEYSNSKDGLGKYLDEKLDLTNGSSVFASETGTIKNKVDFCKKSCELMNSCDFNWSLTPELEKLCEKIFSYISNQNQ